MKPRCVWVLVVSAALGTSAAFAQAGNSYPPVTIPETEVRTLHSQATGHNYDLYIHRPGRIALNSARKYPVLYLLDGQWDFKLLASIQGGLFYDRYVPDLIIVGITYSGPTANYDSLRAVDYTPAAARANPNSGGAARFLDFMKRELMPFVESQYPADPARRGLMGNSLGGLFALYAMFSEPQLFSGYVAGSPAVTFESRTIMEERHSGNKPEGLNRGMRFLFRDTTAAAEPGAPVTIGSIERLDPALDALIAREARIEVLADGFDWAEGPVWRKEGHLLFSDVPKNTIYKWKEGEGISVFLRPSGYIGANPPGRELGSNGLTLDARGALVMADHGNRQVARLDEARFTKVTLADRFEGKRLNSPNDLVFRSNGDLYFTDPPFGLARLKNDPAKELPFSGVYRLTPAGALSLVTKELDFPNGIAFSPDEKTLYVSNADAKKPIWLAYDVQDGGSLARGRVFFDASSFVRAGQPGVPDGMRVDPRGNVFATGPGGVYVLDKQGKHLGTIRTGQPTANCAFSDDGLTLYITANHQLLRVRLR